jgi:integrase
MENISLSALISKYLLWCEKHRSARSHEWYAGHLKSFLAHPGITELAVMDLKPFHIIDWTDSKPTWGDTYKRGAIVAVQRVLNWACEMGYIETTPIKKIKKPTAKRREIFMTKEDFESILSRLSVNDPFRKLVEFVWCSGCRPQEVRHIEARHFDPLQERIIFPAEEAKGKRDKRYIYLQGRSLEIIKELLADETSGGKLFKNKRGQAWTKYAICNRMHRLSKVMGKRLFMYAARHGFGTRKLIAGHDHLTVAALMGHKDGSMLAKIYSHVEKDVEHLRRALAD